MQRNYANCNNSTTLAIVHDFFSSSFQIYTNKIKFRNLKRGRKKEKQSNISKLSRSVCFRFVSIPYEIHMMMMIKKISVDIKVNDGFFIPNTNKKNNDPLFYFCLSIYFQCVFTNLYYQFKNEMNFLISIWSNHVQSVSKTLFSLYEFCGTKCSSFSFL